MNRELESRNFEPSARDKQVGNFNDDQQVGIKLGDFSKKKIKKL